MADSSSDRTDRVIVITGASSGFGKGAALKLAERGASLVLAARRGDVLQDLAAKCREAGGEAEVVETDVSDHEQVERLAQAAIDRFGRLDVWINDAGVGALGRFDEVPLKDHLAVIDTNLKGVISGTHAALKIFRGQQRGTIINVSSGLGKIPAPYYGSYVASKFGIVGLDDSIRQELKLNKETGIHVCTVMPMAMDTNFFDHAANYTGKEPQPVGPLYDPEKVVDELVKLSTADKPESEVIVGTAGKMYNALHHLFPNLIESVMAKRTEKDQFHDVPAGQDDSGSLHHAEAEGTAVQAGRL